MSTIGERLRFLREKTLSLPRDRFVEGTGITPKTLERYENDETSPDANFINKLWHKYSRYLALQDIEWLLTGVRAAEEDAAYRVTPILTEEEKEYVQKLLHVLRNPNTKKAIMENLDTFMKVPKPDRPLDEKKGGMNRS